MLVLDQPSAPTRGVVPRPTADGRPTAVRPDVPLDARP